MMHKFIHNVTLNKISFLDQLFHNLYGAQYREVYVMFNGNLTI